MSLFIAGAIAGASLLAGFLMAMSEQIRSKWHRRCEAERVRVAEPHPKKVAAKSRGSARDAAPVSAESRAAAYQEILDALGNDLDEDIAEWEAVLEEFPQVIGAEELRQTEDQAGELALEASQETASKLSTPREKITPPHRTRRILGDERDMILRLMRTGFAPEEIALWLNLPLERVQEFLPRD